MTRYVKNNEISLVARLDYFIPTLLQALKFLLHQRKKTHCFFKGHPIWALKLHQGKNSHHISWLKRFTLTCYQLFVMVLNRT